MEGLSVVAVSVAAMDNYGTTLTSDECRTAIRAAMTAITELVGQLSQVETSELAPLLRLLDELTALAEGARAAVLREAESRGVSLAAQGAQARSHPVMRV